MQGNHLVVWYENNKDDRYYFDLELQIYLKTEEMKLDQAVIKRSDITVQHNSITECGALCLFVFFHLTRGIPFPVTLTTLRERHNRKKNPRLVIKHDI